MSVKQKNNFQVFGSGGELSMAEPKWWHHLLAWSFSVMVLVLTYALALEGVGIGAMIPPITLAGVLVTYLYGQRLEYLKVGEYVLIETEQAEDEKETVTIEYDDRE